MITKKLSFHHFFIAFIICAILGGWISFRLLTAISTKSQSEIAQVEKSSDMIPSTGWFQNNILLVEVDHLTNPQPVLQSVWAIFSVPTNPAFITIKQLFPSTSEPEFAAKLHESFLMTGEKKPSPEFLQEITDRFPLDGVIVVDADSLQAIHTLLTKKTDSDANSSENISTQSTLKQICSQINQNSLSMEIAWNSILSEHLLADIDLDLAVKTWKAITAENNYHHCEIIE